MPTTFAKCILLSWIVLFGALSSGCLNLKPQPNLTRQFTLSKTETASLAGNLDGTAPTIGFRRVSIPDYLKSNKIALREGTNEIVYLPFHRWAEPLESGIARLLGEYLVLSGTASATFTPPWRSNAHFDYIIEIDVSAFEGRNEGTVTIDCFYSLYDGNGIRIDSGRLIQSDFGWDKSSYEALVIAQSEAVESLASHIRDRIIIATASPAQPHTRK